MLAGAALTLAVSVGTVQYYDLPPISYLGALAPMGILGLFGYRSIAASRDRKALHDERTAELYGKVSINAFWWLLSIILLDSAFGVFPEERSSVLNIFCGLGFYALYFVYYRYFE